MCTCTGAERERQMGASPIRLIKWAQGQSLKPHSAIQQQPECNPVYKSAVRSTISAALRAVYAVRRSTAVCCGELCCVVETQSVAIRRLSLRACQFSKVFLVQKKYFSAVL